MNTNQAVIITAIGSTGHYWHNDFELYLRKPNSAFPNISVNANMDDLLLCPSIKKLPALATIGIYCGQRKTSNLTAYLQPFIEEAKIILSNDMLMGNIFL